MSRWRSIRRLFYSPSSERKNRRRAVKLRLESLEDRVVPTTWDVTSLADSGTGTLRGAVAAAQSGDGIVFDRSIQGGTIALNSEIPITVNLSIGGMTHTGVTISGQNLTRLFEIVSGSSDIDGLTLTNGNDNSSTGGGAILVDSGATLGTAYDTFSNNSAVNGGAIENQGTLNVHVGSFFSGNTASSNGGAIDNRSVLDISPNIPNIADFESNTAGAHGGAIASEGNGAGQVTIINSHLNYNTTTSGNGGALYTTDPTTLNGDSFDHDQSNGNGGAIESAIGNGGQLSDTNSTYSNNTANGGNGGAIDTANTVTLTTDTFNANLAKFLTGAGGAGGAVQNGSGKVMNIYGGSFTSNQSDKRGGAIGNLGELTVVASPTGGASFDSNIAGTTGGAIDSSGNGLGQLSVSSSTFTSNKAPNGGAISTNDASTLTNDTFGAPNQGNSATANLGAGGAVSALAAPSYFGVQLNVNSCSFANNQATNLGSGGAIYSSAPADIEQSTFSNNTSTVYGGAVEFNITPSAFSTYSTTINLSTFTNNSSQNGGGVAALLGNNFGGSLQTTVTNSTFATNKATGNGAGTGGGLYVSVGSSGSGSASTSTLTNDTFFQNTSDGHGGGLTVTANDTAGRPNSTAVLTSLTVYQNTAAIDSGGMYINTTLTNVVSVDNSIFSGNSVTAIGYNGPVDVTFSNPNVNVFKTEQYNLVGTSDTMFTSNTDPAKTNTPGLANALAANGAPQGYPQTLALMNNSPGFGQGDQTLAGQSAPNGIDERGFHRQANKVSIGAEDPDAT